MRRAIICGLLACAVSACSARSGRIAVVTAPVVGNVTACVYAEDDRGPAPMVMVQAGRFPYQHATAHEQWVFVEGFLIDKYEVTNRFYCQFLNDVDSDGDRWEDKRRAIQSAT